MTPRQADKLIKSGQRVTLYNTWFREYSANVLLVARERGNVRTDKGQVLSRDELVLARPGWDAQPCERI
jgi:hypothetical protein